MALINSTHPILTKAQLLDRAESVIELKREGTFLKSKKGECFQEVQVYQRIAFVEQQWWLVDYRGLFRLRENSPWSPMNETAAKVIGNLLFTLTLCDCPKPSIKPENES